MSALEMTANGEKMSTGVARLVDDAISELHEAQRTLHTLQRTLEVGGLTWHTLESIDDRIHNALAKLGD